MIHAIGLVKSNLSKLFSLITIPFIALTTLFSQIFITNIFKTLYLESYWLLNGIDIASVPVETINLYLLLYFNKNGLWRGSLKDISHVAYLIGMSDISWLSPSLPLNIRCLWAVQPNLTRILGLSYHWTRWAYIP
jgi:hypothetical protein